ncbi:MAG: hypothetical protein KKG14_01155 [Alphaproteobacteria bacterium]|nr:hypothetical protein [Alphaproteobacteria bacterium]MBU2269744.1 hypothetical protein [Alphaproteobacteria bacterium]MBU2417296.1 hypothetical protein [Alphaproteobacteria bacterium]
MKPPALSPLKPTGWALAAVVVAIVFVVVVEAAGFRWDPFDRAGRRLEAAEARAAAAEAEVAARRLESEGAVAQQRRLETHHQQALELGRATTRAGDEARNAYDAEHILDPARAARLAGHDRELCRLAPAICPAASTDPAGGGGYAVPAGAVAGGGRPG